MTRSPALTSSARPGAVNSAASAAASAIVQVSCFMICFLRKYGSCLFLYGKLPCRPLLEIGDVSRAFNRRHLTFTRDQQCAGNVALPGRVDLESQAVGEAVEYPVLRQRQAGSLQHGAGGLRQVRDEVGTDRH